MVEATLESDPADHLQRCDQRVREGPAVAAGHGILERDVQSEFGVQRYLQRCDQRVREGRAVAAGLVVAQRDCGGQVGAWGLSYSAGISACQKGEQWQRALWLLSEMRGAEVEPNLFSYSAAISACEKGEQWQQAMLLLGEMWGAKLAPDVVSTARGSVRARRANSGSVPCLC
ncbi:unnamed protein product [Prorocentrum cordatum]|uniref:Pentatricopeptide repeat-containing protein, chloroplastic n=1 Tax=Prorocentrum cordatum TaxID=2364126 RepID=A0ABN9SYJ6_9DINO|nr:unnamed protein product [Polarella glacialis]